ncbi:MAG: hypothetical protein ACK4V4_09850 [Sphingobacteriales bacterium]|jgi:hypothetical protein
MMKNSLIRNIQAAIIVLLSGLFMTSCYKDLPVDEDGLLITFREECFVSNFELLGTDFQTVRFGAPVIDTVAQTINVTVLTGTDLKNVYPQFTLATDCKLDPKIVGRVDMSDLANPKTWTVISGNRKVKKPYKVIVKYQ